MGFAGCGSILTWSQLFSQRAEWQRERLKVVFTNGVFDILHRGHVDYLIKARSLGDRLVVGVNSDASVMRFKDERRPLVPQDDRLFLLSCLRVVDAVTLFDQDTPRELIRQLKPDILVKGADYRESEIVGAREVKAFGGQVVRIPLTEGKSTTKLIETILERYQQS